MSASLVASSLLAQDDASEVFLLGDDFMPWMVLAFGAALVVGNVLALIRPPRAQDAADGTGAGSGGSAARSRGNTRGSRPTTAASDAPQRPPLARTVVMIVVGAVASVWGLASLLS